MSVLIIIFSETFACISKLIPNGISSPITFLTLSVISPSISSNCSETAAPCKFRRTASIGSLDLIKSIISFIKLSKASEVIVPRGPVVANSRGTNSNPNCCDAL